MDGDAAIGRENDLCSGDELQQLGDIVRVGVAVAVDISLELARAGRDVVEQELCVVGIGVAVLVEVIGSELRRSGQDLAVNRPDTLAAMDTVFGRRYRTPSEETGACVKTSAERVYSMASSVRLFRVKSAE